MAGPLDSDVKTRLSLRTFLAGADLAFAPSSADASEPQGAVAEPHLVAAAVACRAAEVAAAATGAAPAPSAETRRAAAAAVAAAAAAAADAAAPARSKAAATGAADTASAAAAAAAAAALLPCLPHLAAAAEDSVAAVRGVSLTAAGSVAALAGSTAVEHVPAVCTVALNRADVCLHSTEASSTTAAELTAALYTLDTLISTVPGLLFPYLNQILTTLHHPGTLVSADATCAAVATSAREALTQHVEFRLLAPAMLRNLPEEEARGTAALVATVNTLTAGVGALQPSVAVAHVDTVAEVVLTVLDARGRCLLAAPEATSTEPSIGSLDAAAVETATYQVCCPIY